MPLVLIKHCVETQAQKLVSYVFSMQRTDFLSDLCIHNETTSKYRWEHACILCKYSLHMCSKKQPHHLLIPHTNFYFKPWNNDSVSAHQWQISSPFKHDASLQFWISSNDLVTSSHNIRGTFHWWQPSLLIGRMGFSVMQHYPAPCCVSIIYLAKVLATLHVWNGFKCWYLLDCC